MVQPIRQMQPYDGRPARGRTPGTASPAARRLDGRRRRSLPVRLATIVTGEGPRLHVRGRSGYVDVAEATGDSRLATLAAVLAGGPETLDRVRAALRPGGSRGGRVGVRSRRPLAEPDPVPRRELPRARARGRAAADEMARDLRARRRLDRRPLRGPRQAEPHLALRLRGRARRRDRPLRPLHPGAGCALDDRRLRRPQRCDGARVAARVERSGRRARTSTRRCRSGPRWSPPTRWTPPTSS